MPVPPPPVEPPVTPPPPVEPPVTPDSDAGASEEPSFPDSNRRNIIYRLIYETGEMLPEYEAFFDGGEGDAQPCFSDSGGPLIRANAEGELMSYGVVSVSRQSTLSTLPC